MRILLFSLFELPNSCANATRVISFAKMLDLVGHEVELVGISDKEDIHSQGIYQGIEYKTIKAKRLYGIHAYKRIRHLRNEIEKFLENRKYDAIILSNVYYDYSNVFLKYAKKTGAKLIVNAVEWYERDNIMFSGALGKLNFIKNRIALMHTHVRMRNILAISSLLDDYYKSRKCNTVTIPTVIDMKEYECVSSCEKKNDGVIHIAYAGIPGRKDYIVNAINALTLLTDEECAKIELHFYGPRADYLTKLGFTSEQLEICNNRVICHGRIPYTEVKQKIAEADFTILLRPNKRYANAGFPTKVGESMACGTPVIANITSDLGKYIIDGQTGIICENESPEACAKAFKRAIALNDEERQIMKSKTIDMAKRSFDYNVYKDKIADFLNLLK